LRAVHKSQIVIWDIDSNRRLWATCTWVLDNIEQWTHKSLKQAMAVAKKTVSYNIAYLKHNVQMQTIL